MKDFTRKAYIKALQDKKCPRCGRKLTRNSKQYFTFVTAAYEGWCKNNNCRSEWSYRPQAFRGARVTLLNGSL